MRPSNQLQPDAGGNGHDNNSRGDIPNQRRRPLQIGRGLLRERQTTTFQWYPRRPPAALELLKANYSNPEASPIRDKKKPRSRAVNVDLGLGFGTQPRGEQRLQERSALIPRRAARNKLAASRRRALKASLQSDGWGKMAHQRREWDRIDGYEEAPTNPSKPQVLTSKSRHAESV